ncbi:hypothetical protein [Pseudomonas kilonensis]|uniref:hypothetical protein n=1 Tax=Pseudomonas kilonensis TaxID=132476 RepID=UPI00069D4F16|nr:hypothetical protein [Pseudomonas kilonensis]
MYKLNGKAAVANLDAKVENKASSSLARKFSINTSFRGGKPNTEAAEKYLRGKQLWGDVLTHDVVHADETLVQMLTLGAKKTHRAYV